MNIMENRQPGGDGRPTILLRNAEIGGRRMDVGLSGGLISVIAPSVDPSGFAQVVDAAGGALLPGLHDHHIHLNATAAALASVVCGPPSVGDMRALAAALNDAPGSGWLRGIGYHDSVAGPLTRDWLDSNGPARPVRIQHRSGRLWILNGLALDAINMPRTHDGRFLDSDEWLRERLPGAVADLGPVGVHLASRGVTGVTEVTPRNGIADYRHYALSGMPQRLLVMGRPELDAVSPLARAVRGAVKLHHHDHDLPALDMVIQQVANAHAAGRAVAAHCVTPAELMLILAAIEEAGPIFGDRIEHGAIIGPETLEWIARLGLTVVTQPHFLTERADAYRRDVDAVDIPFLYRLGSLKRRGIPVAAGSDAPFGAADPWASMAAAVTRPPGFGIDEALTPDEALQLYTGAAEAPGSVERKAAVGALADLCLLDRGWSTARANLADVAVRLTLIDGAIAYRSS